VKDIGVHQYASALCGVQSSEVERAAAGESLGHQLGDKIPCAGTQNGAKV